MINFSVLVPVYNVESYLRQCIESILRQTYSNLEIICIDDGSTDNSGKILDEYAGMDDRITVIHKENTGYGHSMNLGLKAASGDFISIVESDDYIADNLYEKIAAVIEAEENELDVIKTNYYCVSDHEIRKRDIYTKENCGHVMAVRDYKELFGFPCCIWGGAYRREFLEQWDIRFLETPGASYQDTSFLFKVWATAKKIYFIHEAYLFYRTDNLNSSVNSKSKLFCICEEIKEIERYMDEYGIHEPYLNGGKGVFTCRAYMWTYYRLHPGLRSAFWVEMIRKFKEISLSAGFSQKFWDEKHWKDINRVLADPEAFFWQTNKELKDWDLDQYTIKNTVYRQGIVSYLQLQSEIVIYGAGVYGKRVFEFLGRQGMQKKVRCFAVTEQTEDKVTIEGLPVKAIDAVLKETPEIFVIVAVAEKNQRPMLEKLRRQKKCHVLRIDREWMELLNG